jgi:hypothetical protein
VLSLRSGGEEIIYARHYYLTMWRLQKSQLHHHQKQKEAHRTDGNQEVLQHLPQTDGAQRSEMTGSAGLVLVLGESSNG